MATKKKATPKKKTATRRKAVRKKKVTPIPDDFPNMSPYLVVKDARKAMDFYVKAFGFKVKGDCMEMGKTVIHAVLEYGDSAVMIGPAMAPKAEATPNTLKMKKKAFGLFCYVKDVDAHYKRVKRFKGITVTPPETMFWGDRVYEVVDRDGHRWSFASRVALLTGDEMKAALGAMMAGGK